MNVWNIDANLSKQEIAEKSIDATREFFNSLGIPSTLKEVGIDEEKLELMAGKAAASLANAYIPLDKEAVLTIFKNSLS